MKNELTKIELGTIMEEVLKTEEFKSLLREVLANKIANEYHFRDSEGELIKEEVRELIKKEAELAIKELVENYYELKTVKEMIHDEIRKFSKKELIDLINK